MHSYNKVSNPGLKLAYMPKYFLKIITRSKGLTGSPMIVRQFAILVHICVGFYRGPRDAQRRKPEGQWQKEMQCAIWYDLGVHLRSTYIFQNKNSRIEFRGQVTCLFLNMLNIVRKCAQVLAGEWTFLVIPPCHTRRNEKFPLFLPTSNAHP